MTATAAATTDDGEKLLESPCPESFALHALREAGLRAELVLSHVRFVFCGLITVRVVWIHAARPLPYTYERASLTLVACTLAMIFSAWTISRIRRKDALRYPWLLGSVLLDCLFCTTALASNVLWPWREYAGVLLLPDVVCYVTMVLAAGYRASSRLALAGAAANGVSLAALVVTDMRLNPSQVAYGVEEISLHAVLLVCTSAVSIAIAMRTERLVLRAADYGLRTDRARRGMSVVLQEHHDAMAFLSAALFSAGRLATAGHAGRDALLTLRADLEGLHRAIVGIKEEALGGVVALDEIEELDLSASLFGKRAVYERLVAPMVVRWQLPTASIPLRIAGGHRTLQRVLVNLLMNARDGDGTRSATLATVRARTRGDHVLLSVEDDGPGLVPESLKTGGTGSGLRFVRAVAEASGGTFQLESGPQGARAVLVIPCDSSARPRPEIDREVDASLSALPH